MMPKGEVQPHERGRFDVPERQVTSVVSAVEPAGGEEAATTVIAPADEFSDRRARVSAGARLSSSRRQPDGAHPSVTRRPSGREVRSETMRTAPPSRS